MNKKIVASLRYGRVNPWPLNLLWAAFAVLGAVLFIIISLISIPEKDWAAFAAGLGVGLLFVFAGIYALIGDLFIKSKIKLWQADAVKLGAYSEKLFSDFSFSGGFKVAIRVRFKYSDKRYNRVSGGKCKVESFWGFSKYSDRKISILYSPKYDEVMILKD
ncbi:MAG: hypothetical protein K2O41_07495 [Clostridia bacterium]|nr:hypothetical protein [Clostridia bacterium]